MLVAGSAGRQMCVLVLSVWTCLGLGGDEGMRGLQQPSYAGFALARRAALAGSWLSLSSYPSYQSTRLWQVLGWLSKQVHLVHCSAL
jgi:hypothetical protein